MTNHQKMTLFSKLNVGNSTIELPEATETHFFTSGVMVSYFPQINVNGFLFFEDEVSDKVDTLVGSTVDLQHVKLGTDVQDPLKDKFTNTTCGAITEAKGDDTGINILCKLERSSVAAMGFTPEDFEPGKGVFAFYSQECDYNPLDSQYVILDKNDHNKIVKKVSYLEGLASGYPAIQGQLGPSHLGRDGRWEYAKDEKGDHIFMSVKPLSFTGVGHVKVPADKSAVTYKLAAQAINEAMDSHGSPGGPTMDIGDAGAPGLMIGDDSMPQNPWAKYLAPDGFMELSDVPGGEGGGGADVQPFYVKDLQQHPDIFYADVDKHMQEHAEPPMNDWPNTHFAACWMESDHDNMVDGKPTQVMKKAFRIRDDKGNLHRGKLVAAYKALCGFRGATTLANNIPMACRAFAMALVRQGLNNTKPIRNKELSSQAMIDLTGLSEEKALEAIETELRKAKKIVSQGEYDDTVGTLKAKVAELETAVASLTTEKDSLSTAVAEKDALVKKFSDAQLASSRLARLEEILPFGEDEKKAETFGEYVTSLASFSDESFSIKVLERELIKRDKALASLSRSVSSAGINVPETHPVPAFNGGDGGKPARPNMLELI